MNTKTKQTHTPTPGPWHNPEDSASVFVGKGPNRQKICDTYWLTILPHEARANARLIAAAPQLLEACKAALERLEASQPPPNGATEQVCKQLLTAIRRSS